MSNDRQRVDVLTNAQGIDRVETKVDNLKTAPTGSYTNNPLDYVDPKAAARAHVDKNAVAGTYTLTTNPYPSDKAPVVTQVTNTFAPGTQGYKTSIEEIPSSVPKEYTDYRVTNTYTEANAFGKANSFGNNNNIPSNFNFASSDAGNLKISRADIGNENNVYNANKVYNTVESNVKRVEFPSGNDTRVVTRIN